MCYAIVNLNVTEFFKSLPVSLQEDLVLRRTLMLLGLSIFSVFFSHVIGFAGAGGLCTLVLAFLAALGWKKDKVTHIRITSMVSHNISSLLTDDITGSVQARLFEVVVYLYIQAPVAAMVGLSWDVFQPLLFGLIGAEITITKLNPSTVGKNCT